MTRISRSRRGGSSVEMHLEGLLNTIFADFKLSPANPSQKSLIDSINLCELSRLATVPVAWIRRKAMPVAAPVPAHVESWLHASIHVFVGLNFDAGCRPGPEAIRRVASGKKNSKNTQGVWRMRRLPELKFHYNDTRLHNSSITIQEISPCFPGGVPRGVHGPKRSGWCGPHGSMATESRAMSRNDLVDCSPRRFGCSLF